jgi:hypothetical protein
MLSVRASSSNYKLLIKMRNQCKCELPYVRSGSDTCTQCGNQNGYFLKKIVEGKEYDKAKHLNRDEHAVGDIHAVWQKPFGCFVKIVELHKDGWVKVQVPNGGYMDTQILGEKVGVGSV